MVPMMIPVHKCNELSFNWFESWDGELAESEHYLVT